MYVPRTVSAFCLTPAATPSCAYYLLTVPQALGDADVPHLPSRRRGQRAEPGAPPSLPVVWDDGADGRGDGVGAGIFHEGG